MGKAVAVLREGVAGAQRGPNRKISKQQVRFSCLEQPGRRRLKRRIS